MKRKSVSVIMLVALLACVCLSMASCGDGKQDITIRVVRVFVTENGISGAHIEKEYIFTPDVDEIHIEQQYDGYRYGFYIHSYGFAEWPANGERWKKATGAKGRRFQSTLISSVSTTYVCDRGQYVLECYTVGVTWNYREFKLIIDVV
ncbi:MAG: hypothetical protein NC132_02355 [Corallococcus sp.]|nr:hypothetical protein [Corallococcus sp.]MCM1358951.1 hypothetical protein [Corallococcus sp.]MCM1394940.1 hypothetical protein [Corallococcus sp.]